MSEITVDKIRSLIVVEVDTKKIAAALKSISKLDFALQRTTRAGFFLNEEFKKIKGTLNDVQREIHQTERAQNKLSGRMSRGISIKKTAQERVVGDKTSRRSSGGTRGLGGRGRAASGGSSLVGGMLPGGVGGLAAAGVFAIGRGLVSSTQAAIEFESKMAEVRKVVDELKDPKEFKAMGEEIRNLSATVPIAAEGIADIVAAGAQSGIAKNELIDFAEQAAKVGVAFDISADQAGEAFAKVKTGMGLTTEQTKNLLGSINEVSNALAATAPEVLQVVKEVGALGRVAGLTGEQTAALGGAMIAAGANASQATTATKNLFIALVKGNGASEKTKETFKSLGLSVTDVAKRMQQDAEGTIKDVFSRLRSLPVDEQAAAVNQIFGGVSVKAIGPLLNNAALLDQAFKTAQDTIKTSSSIQKEFDSRSNTTANTIQLLKNRFENTKIEIGDRLLPVLQKLLKLFDNPAVKKAMNELFDGFMHGIEYILSNMPNMDNALGVFIDLIKETGKAFKTAWDFIRPVFEGVQTLLADTGGDFLSTFKEINDALSEFGAMITSVFTSAEGDAKGFGSVVMEGLAKTIKTALTSIRESFTLLKNLFSDLRSIIESFKNGNLWEGVKKIGDMLLKAVLEPLRLVTRQLIRFTEAIPGMQGFIPDSIKAFAFSGDQQEKIQGGADSGGAGISAFSKSLQKQRRAKTLEEINKQTSEIMAPYLNVVGPSEPLKTSIPGDTNKFKLGPKSSGGKEKKEELDAFASLVESKIEERVKAAELRAGAAGLNISAAGKTARTEGERLARERRFAALGIDPLSLLGPQAGMGVGADSKPPVSVTLIQVQAGAIRELNIHAGNLQGSPHAIGQSLMNLVIDQVSQAAQLRATPQVS